MPVPNMIRAAVFGLICAGALIAGCSDDQPNDDPGDVGGTPTAERETEETSQVVESSGLAVAYENVEELTRGSDLVVRGTVAEILDPFKVEPGEPPFEERDPEMYPPTIYTDVVLEVSEVIKGNEETTITIRQVGGSVDGISHVSEDALDFVPGDDLILFLADHSDQGYGDVYWVTGVSQGFWEVGPAGEVHPLIDQYDPRNLEDFQEELSRYASSDGLDP